MKRLLLVAFTFFAGFANAQAPEQDCVNAISIDTFASYPSTSYDGYGAIYDNIDTLSCLAEEINSIWFKMYVDAPGTLGFNICPGSNDDDYDWAVYNLTGKTCNSINTNISNVSTLCNASGSITPTSCTGATGGSTPQEEDMLNVLAGQVYYLVVLRKWGVENFTLDVFGTASLGTPVTGVNEKEFTIGAELFPNPTGQNITLKLANLNPGEGYTLAIYNGAGALVIEENLHQQQTTLNVSNLSQGLYTYRIVTAAGKTAAGRIVKE